MDANFWNLFWTTGMPEAWLMSRGGERLPQADQDGIQGPPAPGGPPPAPDDAPGGPGNLY